MHYMLMIYNDRNAMNALSQREVDEIGSAHKTLQRELTESGELIDHKELATEDAKVVRVDDAAPVVGEGPFSEGKQILGGYYLIDCADLARATQIAGRFREAAFSPVEVRRLSGETSWDTRAADAR